MKNPLIKRVPRELLKDLPKYLVVIIFMTFMIGVVSGMYVGHDSMLAAIDSSRASCNPEDGNFELSKQLTADQIRKIESGKRPVTLYEHFFRNEEEDYDGDGKKDAALRLYRSDSEADKAIFNEGRAPESADEIAIDRMHADNVGIAVGDQISVGGKEFTVTGLLSYVNYVTLHEKNTDLMFDAFGFDVGMVTPEAFDDLQAKLHYSYVFMYKEKPADDIEAADFSEDFMKDLLTSTITWQNRLEDYVPEYVNQAIHFAPEDIEGDTAGAGILVYILITVIAFIFAIMVSNTIESESAVIGTLRASGFTRGELIRHYMTMPVIVTLIGAALGNLAGYTVFKDIVVYLYYNSYSLPKYETVWSPSALVKTTVIPLILMFFINLLVISSKLRLSPLRFLRHDLKKTKRQKAIRLPHWPFLSRFRLRVVLQNIPDYLVLVVGVILIEVMLCFAFGFPASLDHYAETAPQMLFTKNQYMLTGMKDESGEVITTDTKGAERFNSITLQQEKAKIASEGGFGGGSYEDVTVYGYEKGSAYIEIDEEMEDGEVFISKAYAKKYGFGEGDRISLSEKYERKDYDFTVAGVYPYEGAVAVFMPLDGFNRTFGNEEGAFNGYFSDEKITDIDSQYIATVMTKKDITKVTDQLQHSMGDFFAVFQYVLLVLAIVLIYLLTKIIIEKNENAISMSKILGFQNGEIASVYMLPTAIVVLIFTGISFVIGYYIMVLLFRVFMMSMDGWFEFYISPVGAALSMLFMIIGYLVVSLLDYRRIRKIPMEEALKNIE